MDLIIIVGSVIVLIIVVLIAAWGFINLDIISYTAICSKTLNPNGSLKGNARIVYNPGLSGAAMKAANDIAEDIKTKGYKVDLSGVRSKNTAKTSEYDIIIAGGPMYWGKVSNSIDKYLKNIKLPKDTELGVFATTGSTELHNDDIASLEKQVASNLSENKKAVTKTLRSGEINKKDCIDFVSAVMQ
jgi:menaquinone-dependent protoporphyrinogen IX oxidase